MRYGSSVDCTERERQRWERRCKVLEARLARIREIVG